ncbi:MAG: peptidoglycan editing factor PgeF [Gemmobacter sp.]
MLEVIRSDVLAEVRHGFFTRRGGASSGIFEGLNCGPGSSDMAEAVAINRARAAAEIGVDLSQLVTVHQVHGARVLTLDAPPAGDLRADAMVTRVPGLALGVLTADCAPVLLADVAAGVIGAAHAGWRGARAGVLEATVAAMESLGATRPRIAAAIGPTISQACYEVGPEFVEAFVDDDPETGRFFAGGNGGKAHFDLPGYALWRLRAAGVGDAAWTRHCTYGDAARFYSYRRTTHAAEADYGRLIALIRL